MKHEKYMQNKRLELTIEGWLVAVRLVPVTMTMLCPVSD